MYVIGTAGHVDHGKSTLVHALTGIDPDRLREEKERGMTIDLGFAWLTLPSGKEVSLVDVPGHERFIKNMLAGVGGIDLALLLVAADEGVMPQTREHLAILDLLGVNHGVVVLTKKDLVDDEWLALVTMDVEEMLKGTSLAGAPLLTVSAITGEGLPELLRTLDQLLESTPTRRDIGRPRLPVDRVFTISGFGTIVTGTLIDGSLSTGQEVEVLPQGLRTRIRGLQTHRTKLEATPPGTRVAANLAGVATEQLGRGDVVTLPGWLTPTDVVDVHLRLVPDLSAPVRHNSPCTFHCLASEALARVRLLDVAELAPGESGWAQLKLERPLALCNGDSFILRSSYGTIGGGTIVDSYPKRHKRFHGPTLQRLSALQQGTPEDQLLQELEKLEPVELSRLLRSTTAPESHTRAALDQLLAEERAVALGVKAVGPATVLVSGGDWRRIESASQAAAAEYHRQYPLRLGMPKEELRSRLHLPARAAGEAVDLLLQRGLLVEQGPTVRLPDHQPLLSLAQEQQAQALLQALEQDPFGANDQLNIDAELLGALVDQGRVVRVSEGILFSAGVYDTLVAQVRQRLQQQGKVTVAEVRDMLSTSRKYVLALLEYMDQQHITRRVGDERVLR